MKLEEHKTLFINYANKKMDQGANSSPMRLKLFHSLKVLEKAQKITGLEKIEPEVAKSVHLAALYHDIGRFDQYLEFGTFKDKASCNHGYLSEKILKESNMLRYECTRSKQIIYTAIALHNRPFLPANLKGNFAIAAKIVRDADKLDILRVMAEHLSGPKPYNPTIILSLPDRKDIFSEKLVDSVINDKQVSYDDLVTVDDFRLLLGAWFSGLYFDSSREIARADGYALSIVKDIPDNDFYHYARIKIINKMEGTGGD